MVIASSGEEYPEATNVFYDTDEIIQRAVDTFYSLKHSCDVCADSEGPSMFVIPGHPVTKGFLDMKRRGILIRFITEITKDNISYCRDLMKVVELKHLDEVKGNFGVADKRIYQGSAKNRESSPPPLLIESTLKAFVEQQQYFFDMLWKKAIPVKQRIKEIEEGIKREFIETIQDSEETSSLISKVLSSATEEILIIFSHAKTLRQYEKKGILDLLKGRSADEIAVRILIGADHQIEEKTIESLKECKNIELRYLLKSIQTKLTTIIIDGQLSLVIEEKEDEDAIGLATYSNSESTVLSYASIFENLWIQSEIKQ
jgi:two-component system sensor histidine kinase VicK